LCCCFGCGVWFLARSPHGRREYRRRLVARRALRSLPVDRRRRLALFWAGMATEPLPVRAAPRRERLDPGVFRLPVERIREGYYSDVYFNRTVDVLRSDQRHPHVLMQVFQKQDAVIGGMDEAIAIIKLCSEDFSQLQVRAL